MDSNELAPEAPAAASPAPEQVAPPKKRLEVAYDVLRKQDVKVPDTYDAFEQAVLAEPDKLKKLYDHFKKSDIQVPDDYGQFEAGMLDGVKKKAQSASGVPAPTSSPAALPAGDKEFRPVTPDTTQPAPDLAMAAEEAALEDTGGRQGAVAVGQPGVDTSSAPYSADMERLAMLRGVNSPEEQAALDKVPALKNSEYPKGFSLEDDNELVMLPKDYKGGLPTGLQADDAGNQYFRRRLSDEVNGKKQTRSEAMLASFNNTVRVIGKGVGDGLQLATNLGSLPYRSAVGEQAAPAATFGDEFSDKLSKQDEPIAPLYTAPGRQNLNTVAVDAAAFAPMVAMQVVQTLAPELRAPAIVQKMLGAAATVGFDAPLLHGARERAKAAGLKGTQADYYTLFEGALTIGAFKLGGKLMGELGDAAVLKAAPKEFSEQVALSATQQAAAMEAKLGRALTKAEQQQALSSALKAALPTLGKVAKGALQQGAVMPLAGTATTIGNQLGARALGGTPEEVTPASFMQDRMRETASGIVMGAGLEAAGGLNRPIAQPGEAPAEAPPAKLSPDTEYHVTGDDSNGPEGAILQARVVGPGTTPDTVVVRGIGAGGAEVEREVEKHRLYNPAQDEPPATAAQGAAPDASPPQAAYPAAQVVAESTRRNLYDKRERIFTDANGNHTEKPTSHEDEAFELDVMAHKAARGKLTFDEFQRSYFGQSTDIGSMGEVRKAFEADPIGFIADVKKHFGEAPTTPTPTPEPVQEPTAAPAAPSVVDVTGQAEPLPAEPLEAVSDAEYADFVDNNVASPERLQAIADKVRAGEQLTDPKEQAIFNGKTAEVEDLIRAGGPAPAEPTAPEPERPTASSDATTFAPSLDAVLIEVDGQAYIVSLHNGVSEVQSASTGARVPQSNKHYAAAIEAAKAKADASKGNWRKEWSSAQDDFRKGDILRAVADISRSKEELREVLSAANGLPDESNIVWAVLSNPAGKELIGEAKSISWQNNNTTQSIAGLHPSPTQQSERPVGPEQPSPPPAPTTAEPGDNANEQTGAADNAGADPAKRKSMVNLDAAPQIAEPLKAEVKKNALDTYEPRSQKEAEKTVDDHLATLSTDEAVAHAIRGDVKNSDVRTILRIKTMERVSNEIDAAEQAGDTATVEKLSKDAYAVADAYAKALTDAGQGISAARLMNRYAPAAVVHNAEREVAEQAEKVAKKVVPKERKKVQAEKKAALDDTLASPAVKAAREKIAGKRPATTKQKIAEAKAERASLFEELRNAGKDKPRVAYSTVVPITPQMAKEAGIRLKIFGTYVKEGVLRVRELVERFKKEGGALAHGIPDAVLAKQAAAALNDHKTATDNEVAALGRTIDQIARDHATDAEAVGKSLAEKFVEGTGLEPAAAKQLADAIEAEFAKRIAGARQKRLDELTKRAAATPAKRPSPTDLQKTQELFTLSPTDDNAILEHLKRTTKIPTLTPEDAANLRALAKKVKLAPEGFQKDAAVGELLKAQAKIKGISKLDVAGAIWYANILAALKTHGINIFANTGQLLLEPSVSVAHGLLRGKGRYAFAGLKGLSKGLQRGARESYSSFTTGREVSNTPGKYDVPSVLEYLTFKGGKANPYNYAKYVGRALRAMDMLFSTGLREMRAYELATSEALADKKNGVPTPDVWAKVAETLYHTKARIADAEAQAKAEGLTGNDYKRRVFEIAEQSRPVELVEDSREYGTRAVFNGDPKGAAATVANGIASIANDISIGGVKPVKLVVPFTRVVSNVANAYMDYTPIGAVRAANSLIRARAAGSNVGGAHLTASEESTRQRLIDGEERERLLIRSVVGAGAMTVLYALSHDKDEDGNPTIEVTGNGTGDVAKDMQLKAQGWMPNSIKYKGTYYSFSNTPFALIGAFVGNVNDGETYRKEGLHDEAKLSNVSKAAFQTLVGIGDITAARGPRDFLQATRTPDAFQAYLRRLTASTATSALPMSNLVNETAGYFYDNRKDAHTFAEAMQRNIPGARDGLNDAVDVLGDPLPNGNPRLWNQVPVRDTQTEQVWAALKKHDLFITVPSKQMGGTLVVRPEAGKETPMNEQEFYDFMKLRGKYLKAALLASLPTLKGDDKLQAEAVLHRAQKVATQQAKLERFGNGGLTNKDRVERRDSQLATQGTSAAGEE